MQIKSLRVKSYRSWRMDDNTSAEALGRLKQLEWVERLRREGCSEATSPAVVGWSRATYYRWLKRYREDGLKGLESGTRAPRGRRICQWTKQQEQQLLHLRKRYPLWGKRKLWRVAGTGAGLALEREHGGAHQTAFAWSPVTTLSASSCLPKSNMIKPDRLRVTDADSLSTPNKGLTSGTYYIY